MKTPPALTDTAEAVRSHNMAAIRSRNTVPEQRFRQALRTAGMRGYRIHLNMPGRPDIVFTRFRVAIFIDGCFWHCCPQCFREPKTHWSYWLPKLRRNADRDSAVTAALESAGWTVLRFWEHQLKHDPEILTCVEEVQKALRGQ